MTFSLAVETRDIHGKKLNTLREAGKLPAVLYGPKEESVSLSVDMRAFEKILQEAGESTMITLTGLKEKKDVLINDVAFDARKGGVIHVDFYAVEAGKEITIDVPLEFVGEAPALKLGGTLTKVLHEIEVTCMPQDIPQHFEIDVTALDTFDKQIHVSDIPVPKGVVINNSPEDVIVLVQAVVEEEDVEVAAVDMGAIEVEKKGKTEDETTEEEK